MSGKEIGRVEFWLICPVWLDGRQSRHKSGFQNRDKKALPPLIRIQKQIAAGHIDASSVLPGGIVHAPLPLDVHFFGLGPIIEMMRALRKSTISASCNNNSGSHGMFLSWGSGVTERITGQKPLLVETSR
jgi:hypothetical protein